MSALNDMIAIIRRALVICAWRTVLSEGERFASFRHFVQFITINYGSVKDGYNKFGIRFGKRRLMLGDAMMGLTSMILVVAALYAAVGQAGASGYLAVMGMAGLDPAMMKPAALALNLLVATIGTVRFARAGLFNWRSFYPFGILGMPFSFVGGMTNLPPHIYYPAVGAILLLAALELARSTWATRQKALSSATAEPPFLPALVSGAAIGFLSGMTGTGGGVFLAPLVLLMGWVETRRAAAVSAAYNLLNSAAALAGTWATLGLLPPALSWWLAAAGIGGAFGAWLGSRHLPTSVLRYLLSAILAASGLKMLLA